MPIGEALVGGSDFQQSCFLERPAHELKREWEPVGGKTAGAAKAGAPVRFHWRV